LSYLFTVDLNKSKKKNSYSDDGSPDAFDMAKGDNEDSFNLDISHSVKNPFDEGADDGSGDGGGSFNSQFLNSPDKQDSDDDNFQAAVADKRKEENKKITLIKQESQNRKKWDRTLQNKNSDKTKSYKRQPKTNNESWEEEEEEGDGSSFISDFGELAQNKPKGKDKSKVKSSSSLIPPNPKMATMNSNTTLFTLDTQSEFLLQYIHAVSCSLEDYLED
jgi:hypothetical protein